MQIGGSQQLVLATVLAPVLWTGVQGPNVASGIGSILSVQEYPRLGEGIGFNRGIQISVQPNVAFGVGSILTIQEQPRLGDAVLGRGVQGPNVATGIGAIFAWQQEQPPQAPSLFSIVQPFTVAIFVPPGARSVLLSQEIPWHPQAPFTFIPSSFTSPVVTKKAEWIIRYRRRGRR